MRNITFKARDPIDGVEHTYTTSTQEEHSSVGHDLPCIRDENGNIPYRRQKTILRNAFGKQYDSNGVELTTHGYIRFIIR